MENIKFDLHIHTNLSDGIASKQQIIQSAKTNNIKYISFTDHNIIDNCKLDNNICIINGVEIDCYYKNKKIHLLGYGLTELKKLKEELNKIKLENDYICRNSIEILKNKYNIIITENDIKKHTSDFISKRIIAKILLEKLRINDIEYIYNNYIGSKSQTYISQKKISLVECINLLKNDNCVSSLAHPITLFNQCSSIIEFEELLIDFYRLELDGIEIINPKNTQEFIEYLKNNIKFSNFIKTAGSDYHSDGTDFLGIDHDSDKYLEPLLKVIK